MSMPETQPEIKPSLTPLAEVSTSNFDILFLSDNPNGFRVFTKNSLLRHASNTPLPFAERIATERAREPRKFRVGSAFTPKVGVRNIELNEDVLLVDTMPVTFPTYKAISDAEITSSEREISNPTGTCVILLTTEHDGSRKLVLQHRSQKNFFYGDIPGASVAGYFDGKLRTKGENKGTLKPIDTDDVKENGNKEMYEEIGLYPRDILDLRITGFASDKVRVHNEFLLMATTKLSSEDLLFRSGAGDHFKFIEQAITINADTKTISTLLTQNKCPLPPTHQAAFLAAGYTLVLEQQGKEAADEWRKKIQIDIDRNYKEIDLMVQKYYQENPDQLSIIPEGKPPRNPNGYEPAYLPSDQGLPDMETELDRLGLAGKELGNVVDDAFIFDVDGVLTDPNKKILDREVMESIARRLKNGLPVILNTGRSISWLQEKILARLYFAHNLTNVSDLQNLFMIGEKGGTWMGFDEKGLMPALPSQDGSISVPKDLQEAVQKIVKDRFSETMAYDQTKLTMISIETNDWLTEEDRISKFLPARKQLVIVLENLIAEHGLSGELKVDPTTIATDIENKHVGKDFAVQRAVAWLKQRKILPKKYITFGDSQSDFAMARQLHDDGFHVEHVHVGKDTSIPQDAQYPITVTDNKFNHGTAEYLKK